MKTMTVAKLKARFSAVLDDVRAGEEIVIEYGKSHKKIGVIVPYDKYCPPQRNIGLREGKASVVIKKDFKIVDKDLFGE